LDVGLNDAELLQREQQLVVRANRIERKLLTRSLHLVYPRAARDLGGSSAFPSLKLKMVCRMSAAVEKRLPGSGLRRVAKLPREFIEIRAVQQARIARAHRDRVPRDVGQRVSLGLGDASPRGEAPAPG
jgi:hypothetical protein